MQHLVASGTLRFGPSAQNSPYENLLALSKFIIVPSFEVEPVGKDFTLKSLVLPGLHFNDNVIVLTEYDTVIDLTVWWLVPEYCSKSVHECRKARFTVRYSVLYLPYYTYILSCQTLGVLYSYCNVILYY